MRLLLVLCTGLALQAQSLEIRCEIQGVPKGYEAMVVGGTFDNFSYLEVVVAEKTDADVSGPSFLIFTGGQGLLTQEPGKLSENRETGDAIFTAERGFTLYLQRIHIGNPTRPDYMYGVSAKFLSKEGKQEERVVPYPHCKQIAQPPNRA